MPSRRRDSILFLVFGARVSMVAGIVCILYELRSAALAVCSSEFLSRPPARVGE